MGTMLPPKPQTIILSHPEKLLFPRVTITKRMLAKYYQAIHALFLFHTKNRPVAIQRYIHGVENPGFFQKNAPDYYPQWINTIKIKNKDRTTTDYLLLNNSATLRYLTNQDCICYHTFLSTTQALDYPDRLIFDLDPQKEIPFAQIARAAQLVRQAMEVAGLTPFVMLTGKRGIHVVCPILPEYPFDTVRAIARTLAHELCAQYPTLFSCHIRKKKREAPIYLDIMRNAFGQTTVAPYSVRATPQASVATPLFWRELCKEGLSSNKYTIKTINKRLAKITDPWANITSHATSLKKSCSN